MRFFAPIPIRKAEFWPIRLALAANKSPIKASVIYYGLVTFVPVRVDKMLTDGSFEPNFLGNPYPLNELAAIEGSILPFAYAEDGEEDMAASREGLMRFATECEQYLLRGIYIPKGVRNGDILLCSRRYPSRAGGDPDMR